MAYELYKRTAVRVELPTVSIAPEGRIIFNAAATRILAEAGIRSVILLWDKAECKFALRATSRSDKNGYAVSIGPRSTLGHSESDVVSQTYRLDGKRPRDAAGGLERKRKDD